MAEARVVIKGYNELKTPLKQAESDLKSFGQTAQMVGKMIDTASVILAIVAAVKALTEVVSDCTKEFKEQVEVDTRLNAVIKATGQQYKYTTKDIKEFANALQEQTRFGDEAIESAAQLLVATKKFSKEGLERTLELSADLAEAMGTDITAAAQTLSKALIEPGEGLNRLKTIGISFTDAEEDMIKSLREAGDELGAQQVILDKVEASYAGVAKSIGDLDTSKLDKIKSVWSDIKQDLGQLFTTTLGPVFNWIYTTLRWLERLMNQTIEKGNLNKYLANHDVEAIANNFTVDYLTKEREKMKSDYDYAVRDLRETWSTSWDAIERELGYTFEQFIELDRQKQKDILWYMRETFPQEIYGYNGGWSNERVTSILYELEMGLSDYQMLGKAIDIINADVLKAEQFAALQAQQEETDRIIAETQDAISKVLQQYGKLSETYVADTLEGQIQQVQALLEGELDDLTRTYLGEILDNLISQRKVVEEWVRNSESGLGFNFGIKTNFGLPQNNAMMGTNTMSILGVNGVRGLNLGASDILALDEMFKKYARLSSTYQMNTLQEEINTLTGYIEKYVDEDSPIGQYLNEIVESLELQLAQMKKSEKSGGTSGSSQGSQLFHNLGAAMQNFEDAADAVWEDFKGQIGEAGDLINRLSTNMAQFGPLLGAIVTALHYVIEGFVETIGNLLGEFVQWGLEPLREFGRMIGEILLPILREIMPSVVASGRVLMRLFQAIAKVLAPIVEILMKVIGPILTVLADVVVSIIGTVAWALEGLKYVVTWLLNKITFGAVGVSDNPGSLSDYVSNMMVTPGEGYEGLSSGSVGVTNASYSGGTVIHLNVYQQGVVVGEAGISEFAVMIRDELAGIGWNGR